MQQWTMAEANMDACKCDQDLSMVLGMNQERRKGRREEGRKGGGKEGGREGRGEKNGY